MPFHRHLRRSFLLALILPITFLFLFIIYHQRYIVVSEKSSNYPHRYHKFHIEYSTISNRKTQSSKQLHIQNEQQINSSTVNSHVLSQSNIGNHPQSYENLNRFIQKSSPSIHHQKFLPLIETKNLARFVHLDLKGAAPKLSYYENLFPFLKHLGANGLLIEYEDMFPFTDRLTILRHDYAYSKNDIQQILNLAKQNHLQVMPLLQVYGHLEYVLKLKEFMHLREDNRYPQVITPCLEESYQLLFEMIDQLLELHPSIAHLHIGCDEVYYRLIHPRCTKLHFRDDADLFIRHVTRIAKYIKSKRPHIKLFIWHDMLSQLVSSRYHNITELIGLVVPMVWAYVDDVKMWFDEYFWMKFAMFPEVWVASSYKGSSGEITTMSYIGHHQRNQQTWLETMYIAKTKHKVNFTGVAVTGWSRYDHMLSLCEFLPSSIPSLAYTLQTIVFGRITKKLNESIARSILGCVQTPLWERAANPSYVVCKFPGNEMYSIMFHYDNIKRQYDETMSFVRLYITDTHIKENYIHYKRTEECFERLINLENQMISFMDAFQNTCSLFFTSDIGPEWLLTYFIHDFEEVRQRLDFVERALKTQSMWSQRPLSKNLSRITFMKRNMTASYLLRTS